VSTSSSDGRAPVSPKISSLNELGFPDQLFRESNEPPATSGSTSCSESPTLSVSRSQISSFRRAHQRWTMTNSLAVPRPTTTISLMPKRSSTPSTKPPDAQSSDSAEPEGRLWRVKFHREPAKIVAKYDPMDPTFRPTLGELVDALSSDPKQFEKKRGKLARCRAADLTFADGVAWRAVFELDESTRTVRVLALGTHDDAYTDAVRRSST
jgi:mRNA-degrading endonuclease RelE of RelBE toxin-antitoxin system